MNRRQAGFTFIEMLLAVAIFALVGMASVAILSTVTNSDEASKDASSRLIELHRTMLMLERDFMQLSPRSVRINGEAAQAKRLYGERHFMASDDHGVTLVRQGWINPAMVLPRSEIQALAYRLKEGALERLFTLYPDAVTGVEPKIQQLQKGLTGFELRYLKDDEWHEYWHNDSFPEAISIVLIDEYLGRIERIFTLPDFVQTQTGAII